MAAIERLVVHAGPLQLSLLDEGEVLHVGCEGEVVLPDYHEGDDLLVKLLGPSVYGRRVLLDMERVVFLDTSGVSWLVNSYGHFQGAGGRLGLCSVPPLVRHVVQLLHLDRILPMAPDVAGGRALLTEGKP